MLAIDHHEADTAPSLGHATMPADHHRDAGDIAGLRRRHEATVAALVIEHRAAMLRLARCYVADRATAEDVVQETWIAVLRGIERFDGRASLKTWIFRILVNRAKTTGARQSRLVPFASLLPADEPQTSVADHAELFDGREHGATRRVAGSGPWNRSTEDQITSAEDANAALRAIVELPPGQRAVITLRDVRSWPAEEVCATMGITDVNQRVLLHRARTQVRRRLEAREAMIGRTA